MDKNLAWDNHLACKNPNCKSNGQSHPNCKCYNYVYKNANGGEIKSFCSDNNPHEESCEYYASGGDVDPGDVKVDSHEDETIDPKDVHVSDNSISPTDVIPDDGPKPSVPPESLSLNSNDKIDPSDVSVDGHGYGSIGEQIGTGLEGVAQGVLSKPLAVAAEVGIGNLSEKAGFPGVAKELSKESIAGRESENPGIHGFSEAAGLTGSLMTGVGEAGLLAKGIAKLAPEATTVLAKIGSAAIADAVSSGVFQFQDNLANTMLLDKGDPETPVANYMAGVGPAMFWGGLGGTATKSAGHGLDYLASKQAGAKAQDYIAGFGWKSVMDKIGREEAAGKYSSEMPELPNYTHKPSFEAGQKAYDSMINSTAKSLAGVVGGSAGYAVKGVPGAATGMALAERFLGPLFNKVLKKPISLTGEKLAYPAALKVISAGDSAGIWNAINYADQINSGLKKINTGVERLFQAGSQQAVDADTPANIKARRKLEDHIDSNGMDQQLEAQKQQGIPAFAEGGEVPTMPQPEQDLSVMPALHGIDVVAQHWPNQAMALGKAKGRINAYLTALRPDKTQQKLPFDGAPDTSLSKKTYGKALDVAAQPLDVLNKIKSGSLDPETMNHFRALYPELHGQLSKKITDKIIKHQLDGKKPPYKMRQSLSYFLGAPLDSTFTPASIQAAQSVFANQQAQQQQVQAQGKTKKGTAPLSKSHEQYQTSDQATEARQRNS